ncbi:hypothetical protein HMPREF1548_01840 [Clostridium sp. KLE 1755]|nr:hypothetical protein HMPREF1548_01840 [Clostridium sp. KLE 1755]
MASGRSPAQQHKRFEMQNVALSLLFVPPPGGGMKIIMSIHRRLLRFVRWLLRYLKD